MAQNPHRQPNMHPGTEDGGPESTGARRDTSLATAPAGDEPTTSRQISHVISPRSLFETARKRCNSNDMDSTFELIAWELRATLMGGGRAWPSIETTLVVDEVVHPIGKSQPQLIGGNAPSRVECSRSGGIFTMGRILSEELRREHASPTTPPSTLPGTEPRPTRLVL